jgi:hypothetical protein
MSQTSPESELHSAKPVTVHVNEKPVELRSHKITGLEIKKAAIDQGVEIQLDFELTEEAHGEHPARRIRDDEEITVSDHSEFLAHPQSPITIVVNGQLKTVAARDVSWEEAVDLAYPGQREDEDLTFVVTYSDAEHGKSGILEKGGTVPVKKEGTSFNVAKHRRS